MAIKYLLICLLVALNLIAASNERLYQALDGYYDNNQSNDAATIEALKSVAKSGNSDAAFLVALSYERGTHTPKRPDKALFWYEYAAKLGDVDAMSVTAWLYYQADSPAADLNRSIYWFNRAAQHGDDDAKTMLNVLKP